MLGGAGVGSFAFVCAGRVVRSVFLPFPALPRPPLGFPRPSCLPTILLFFRWRRCWAVMFSIPGWRCRVAPSVLLFFHTFLLLCGVSYCMFSVRLLAAACMCEYSMGIPFAPYAGVQGWACSLGYFPSVTLGGAVFVVLFPLSWRGVACNILVLVLSHGCT